MKAAHRFYRLRSWLRCLLGIHRLRGYWSLPDSPQVSPYPARTTAPRQHAWRKCEWCGARWRAAYDPMCGPFWQRVR